MPLIKAGAFDLDYWEAGHGPALVLVHSSASGNRQWRRLADALQDRYRLIAVNLFGYGATSSWPGDRKQTLRDQADLVMAAAVIAQEPVVLIGHSLGGVVALEAVLRLGERARMGIVFEPIPFYLLRDHAPDGVFTEIAGIGSGFRERAARGDWDGAGTLFIDYWSGEGAWAALTPERKAGVLAMLPLVIQEWDAVLTPSRTLQEWQSISIPMHVIRAADTRRPAHTLANLLTATGGAWRLHEVAEGGHMAPVGRPDLVNPLIAGLL
jgi:pimeloyl-ACP methyl ester carboxylesterase